MLLIKKLRLAAHLLRGLLTCAFIFPRLSVEQKTTRARAWSTRLLELCGMRLVVHQQAPLAEGGVMLVCNHISWIDIFAINAWRPVRFVAKAEIRQWPLVGWLSVQMGTIFLQRERRADAKRIMHHLAELLDAGEALTVFPEGTTSDGTTLLPFHANLLQAPASTGKAIQPLCLYYADAADGGQSMAPSYAGDTTLMQSINAILSAPPLTVHLSIGEPLSIPEGAHRREVAALAEAAVAQALCGFQREEGVSEMVAVVETAEVLEPMISGS
ncbi:MAG: 1-acyl-sn-glycerol-3-phosphate acyltransferase [Burkholderiales bacterium]|nr:1-acyl-sn-glycerol-3-phosphate acyltransferase [Burkholderiales bacterium]